MSDKLHELTEKLYREGVENARKEAEFIIVTTAWGNGFINRLGEYNPLMTKLLTRNL